MTEQQLKCEMKMFLNLCQDKRATIQELHDIAIKRNVYSYNMFCQRFFYSMVLILNRKTDQVVDEALQDHFLINDQPKDYAA